MGVTIVERETAHQRRTQEGREGEQGRLRNEGSLEVDRARSSISQYRGRSFTVDSQLSAKVQVILFVFLGRPGEVWLLGSNRHSSDVDPSRRASLRYSSPEKRENKKKLREARGSSFHHHLGPRFASLRYPESSR